MPKWIKTHFKGVRYREHPIRKHGVRRDRYYTIRYKLDGKDREEKLGWESEWAKTEQIRKEEGKATGRSLEQEATHRLSEITINRSSGSGAFTLEELRSENMAKREAETAERKAKAKAMITLNEFWTKTYFLSAQQKKKACSWVKEQQHFNRWISPILGEMPLRDVDSDQWDDLKRSLITAGLSQRSQQYILGTLRLILRTAYDRRLVDKPPLSGKRVGVTGPGNNRRLRVISPAEEDSIMQELQFLDEHAWRITRFAFLTGCRASEAFNLTWANVDSARGYTTFAETQNNDPRGIPITPPLKDLFDSMTPGRPRDRVFTKGNGSPYTQAPSPFQTTVEHLGLNDGREKRDRIVFHSIRHSVATRLAVRLGMRDLMDVMGWRTVLMAARYIHSNEEAKLKALSMLGSAPQTGKVLEFQARTQTALNTQ